MEKEPELSWDALAVRLGVSRQSVVNWRNMEGAPKGRDVEEWKAFVAANNLGARGPKTGGVLKDEKTRHEIEILKARLDREHRKVIDREEVNRLLLHIGTDLRTMLYQYLETEAAPKLDGMSAGQMRPILREMADAILGRASDTIARFNAQ
jgi:hypothetical protein